MKQQMLLFRRWLLRNFMPEWLWPKQIVLDGVGIPVRSMPWSFGTKWLLCKKGYEAEERALLLEFLMPGMQVIEMGSSIGILTAIVAEKIGVNGRILAVEASPTLTKTSSVWLSKYKNCTILTGYGFPVWSAPNVEISGFNEIRGSLGGTVSFTTTDFQKVSANPLVFDLQKICNEYKIRPQILLIDVEGSERIMMEVPLDLPASVTDIVMELHPGLYPGKKKDQEAIISAIQHNGFSVKASLNGVWHFTRI